MLGMTHFAPRTNRQQQNRNNHYQATAQLVAEKILQLTMVEDDGLQPKTR